MKRLTKVFTGARDPLADFKVLDNEPAFAVGHQGIWTAQPGLERSSKAPVTIITCREDDVCTRLSGDPAAVEEVMGRAEASIKALARFRHPGVVRVLKPVEAEGSGRKRRLVAVVERMEMDLPAWRREQQARHRPSLAPRQGGSAGRADPMDDVFADPPTAGAQGHRGNDSGGADGGIDTVETELGLCNIARTLNFLHEVGRCAHLGLSPAAVVLCRPSAAPLSSSMAGGGSSNPPTPSSAAGPSTASTPPPEVEAAELDWKLFDFTFATPIADLTTIPPGFCTYFGDTRHQCSSGATGSSMLVNPLRCPDLSFASPSYAERNSPSVASDMWSFGCLVHWALNAHGSDDCCLKLKPANDLRIYDRQVSPLVRLLKEAVGGNHHSPQAPAATTAPTLAATDFFGGAMITQAPAPTTPGPAGADGASTSVTQDVELLMASDASPASTWKSFGDFLSKSTLHSQRAKTITEFAGLGTMDPQEKLGTLAAMYKLVPSLSSATLQRRIIPRLTDELVDQRMYRFVVPIVLRCVPRLTVEAVESCCRPPLLMALRCEDANVRHILIDEFAVLQRAAEVDKKIDRCLADWLVEALAWRDLKPELTVTVVKHTSWVLERHARLVEHTLRGLCQAVIRGATSLTDDRQKGLAVIRCSADVFAKGVMSAPISTVDDVLLGHVLGLASDMMGRREADVVALGMLKACLVRCTPSALVQSMQPVAKMVRLASAPGGGQHESSGGQGSGPSAGAMAARLAHDAIDRLHLGADTAASSNS